MATKYHVCGVIEVDVVAENAEAALDLAETRIYRVLDRSAKKLNAVIGLDVVQVEGEIVKDLQGTD
jgi:hypothetical protein